MRKNVIVFRVTCFTIPFIRVFADLSKRLFDYSTNMCHSGPDDSRVSKSVD